MPTDVNPAIDLIVGGYNTQTVNVRGHVAVSVRISEDGHTGGGELLWDEAPGITVQIRGPADIDTLIRIAESRTPCALKGK